MNICYKQLYNDLIINKTKKIIVRYIPKKQNYTYESYSHYCTDISLDDVSKLIIDNIVFYAFSENEIVKHNNEIGLLDDLREAAKYAYIQRLPQRQNANSDGLLGEVLLDLLIQTYSPNAEKLVIRAKHTEINTKREITGYDALYFTKDENGVSFWLGQAKAGQKEYCKSSIVQDLKEKYKKSYFADTAFYIADRKDTNELDDILIGINKICFDAQKQNWDKQTKVNKLFSFLDCKNIKIKIPCLIAYTKDIYGDLAKLKEMIEKEVDSIVDYVDTTMYPIELNLDWELLFWIFPIKDVSYLRDELIRLKKEAI